MKKKDFIKNKSQDENEKSSLNKEDQSDDLFSCDRCLDLIKEKNMEYCDECRLNLCPSCIESHKCLGESK